MATQNFYIQSGGSFLNPGSTTSNTAAYTSTNGNWSTSTNQFIPTDGSTPASSVNVNDYATVYLDAATSAVFIGRITVVAAGVNGAITFSSTIRAGTAPTTGATGRSIKVGGAQKIPTTGDLGPMFKLTGLGSLRSVAGNIIRINCKNDATYRVTLGTNVANSTSIIFQGYTTTPGDKGVAFIDGASGGTSFTLVNFGSGVSVYDFDFSHNGTSSFGNAVVLGGNNIVRRCAFHDMRGSGVLVNGTGVICIECEAYNCNIANAVNEGGFKGGSTIGCKFMRCISHHNSGSNSFGFNVDTNWAMSNCISHSNGGNGITYFLNGDAPTWILHCDCYNNGGYGLKATNGGDAEDALIIVQSCNFVKNGNTGIDLQGGIINPFQGFIDNCGYGSGTMVNGGSGNTANLDQVLVDSGVGALSVTYPVNVTPWVDPDNGDFRINLTQANWAGYGYFTQVAGDGYTSRLTVGFPDIGAAQSKTGAGGTFSKEVALNYVA